ncbi:MAG: hypothetical protein WC223_13390 [Bacteroidales bacterium]|jgi:hypothetical protein
MSKKFKEKIITIEALFVISLEELAFSVLKHEDDYNLLIDILNKNPEIANKKVKENIKRIIRNSKVNVKLKKVKFSYNDSDNFSHGVSYFDVKLKGTEKELKRIAGEDKIFLFNWKCNKEPIIK